MRNLTETEQFMRIITSQSLRDGFIAMQTSPLVTEEDDRTPVYTIRYSMNGRPNTFALGSN